MKKLLYFALPAALLATGCHKDDAAPSKTALLTGPTWQAQTETLTINGTAGTYTPTGTETIKFTADGKYTDTPAGSSPTTGTWAFTNSESQLVLTPSGQPASDPAQIYTLTATSLVVGADYTQAQVQHATNNNNTNPTATDQTILGLIFGSSVFFPKGAPVTSSSQITSLGFRQNLIAK